MPIAPQTIQVSGAGVDLSPRFLANNTVVASPATAEEKVVAQLGPFTGALAVGSGAFIIAQCAYHVGTSGTAAQYRIRTGTTAGAGTVVFDSGVSTAGVTAAAFVVENMTAFDSSPTLPGQSYCLTVAVSAASAASTVSAVSIAAFVI
jgi:hypothetical protein